MPEKTQDEQGRLHANTINVRERKAIAGGVSNQNAVRLATDLSGRATDTLTLKPRTCLRIALRRRTGRLLAQLLELTSGVLFHEARVHQLRCHVWPCWRQPLDGLLIPRPKVS